MTNELAEKIRLLQQRAHLSYYQISKKLGIPETELRDTYKDYLQTSLKNQKELPDKQKVFLNEPKSLQMTIIKRFLQGTDLETFYQNYKKHTKAVGGQKRDYILNQPIDKEDLEVVKLYMTDFNTPIADLAKNKNLTISSFYTKIMRVSMKIVFQNQEVLDKMLTNTN